nr:MAG TPA: hypothetical protein [Caudoviricetes sp.]
MDMIEAIFYLLGNVGSTCPQNCGEQLSTKKC